MLYLESFTFNAFSENTYLVTNDQKQCWIIDPGMYAADETNLLIGHITDNGLIPQSIINTHTHLDHIFGVNALIKKYNIPFIIHPKDLQVLQGAAGSAMLFGFEFRDIPKPTGFLNEHEILLLGKDKVEVRFTPGHSPGHVIFYYPDGKWAVGGDVLFAGSIGRTDLPGGNYDTLINSIRTQLFTLPENTTVHPGHGPATTIENEKKYNPFLQ